MIKLDPQSKPALHSNLDLNSTIPTQYGIVNSHFNIVNSNTPISKSNLGPITFNLTSNSKLFLLPHRTYIYFTFSITKPDGAALDVKHKIGPVNGIGAALIRQFSLYVNNQIFCETSSNAAFQQMIELTTSYSKEEKEGLLGYCGYNYEPVNTGETENFLKRCLKSLKGNKIQYATKIPLSIFRQNRVLPNYTDVKLEIYLNNSNFLLEYYGTEKLDARFNLDDIYVVKNEIELDPALCLSIERSLNESPIMYQTTNISMRTIFIEEGRNDLSSTVVFTNRAPHRMLIAFVPARNYLGNIDCTPFNFVNCSTSDLYVTFNGKTIPSRPLELSWTAENSKFMESYVGFLETMGLGDKTNSITPAMYKSGYTFFAFELSSSYHDNLRDLVQFSNVVVRGNFKQPIPTNGVYALILGEFYETLGIDKNRNPISTNINIL